MPTRPAALLLVLAAACAHAPAPSAPVAVEHPAPHPLPPEVMAPTPYTAEELRRAISEKTVIEYRIEAAGKGTFRRVFTFHDPTETDVETIGTSLDPDGKPLGKPDAERATWEQLRRHAQFPRDAVKISDAVVTVPGGTFDCIRYEVSDPQGVVTTFDFAKGRPGPPVRMVVEQGGQPVMSMTLLRREG